MGGGEFWCLRRLLQSPKVHPVWRTILPFALMRNGGTHRPPVCLFATWVESVLVWRKSSFTIGVRANDNAFRPKARTEKVVCRRPEKLKFIRGWFAGRVNGALGAAIDPRREALVTTLGTDEATEHLASPCDKDPGTPVTAPPRFTPATTHDSNGSCAVRTPTRAAIAACLTRKRPA
jgi:hypothetical protein